MPDEREHERMPLLEHGQQAVPVSHTLNCRWGRGLDTGLDQGLLDPGPACLWNVKEESIGAYKLGRHE